jgi:hypothetical protein
MLLSKFNWVLLANFQQIVIVFALANTPSPSQCSISISEGGDMRSIFGIASLLIVLAIVAVLAKNQLGVQGNPSASKAAGIEVPVVSPGATPQQQSQQVQAQFKQSLDGALQQARPMPDDSK